MIQCQIGYCPKCKKTINFESDYLREIFKDDDFSYWFATLVTHYRHEHITYYDKSWQSSRYKSKNPEAYYNDHETFKQIVNNRIKRQLLRLIIKDNKFNIREKKLYLLASRNMKYNDNKTKEFIETKLKKFQKWKVIYNGIKI